MPGHARSSVTIEWWVDSSYVGRVFDKGTERFASGSNAYQMRH